MAQELAPHDGEKGSLWKTILSYTIYLISWIVLTAGLLWLIFDLRGLIFDLMTISGLYVWTVRGIDRGVIYLFGLGWFIALMWMEHVLRTSIEKDRLWRTIARLALAQIIPAVILLGIRFIV